MNTGSSGFSSPGSTGRGGKGEGVSVGGDVTVGGSGTVGVGVSVNPVTSWQASDVRMRIEVTNRNFILFGMVFSEGYNRHVSKQIRGIF